MIFFFFFPLVCQTGSKYAFFSPRVHRHVCFSHPLISCIRTNSPCTHPSCLPTLISPIDSLPNSLGLPECCNQVVVEKQAFFALILIQFQLYLDNPGKDILIQDRSFNLRTICSSPPPPRPFPLNRDTSPPPQPSTQIVE